jgi:hypothetical protein
VGRIGPVVPIRKYCAVYYLRFEVFYGMEEVVGSIPTRSTKINNLHSYFLRRVREIFGRTRKQHLDHLRIGFALLLPDRSGVNIEGRADVRVAQ